MLPLTSRTVLALVVIALGWGRCGAAEDVVEEAATPLKPHQVDIAARIRKLRSRLTDSQLKYVDASLKNGGVAPTLGISNPSSLRVGSVGRLAVPGNQLTIDEVIGKSEVMIGGGRIKLEGVVTKGIPVDAKGVPVGMKLNVDSVVVVVAEIVTHETAAGGKRSIPRLVAVSTPLANETLAKIIELNRFRDWTDAEGTFLGTAKLLQLKEGSVDLERLDDSEKITIDMDRLTEDDREWVGDELKRQAEEKRAAIARANAAAKKAKR